MNWGQFDIFKQPVRLYLRQRENRHEYDNFKGSIYGTIMTIMLFTICISYFFMEYDNMMNFEYDEQKEQLVANNFKNDNQFSIIDTKFLPMLEIQKFNLKNPSELFDFDEILTNEKIDMAKLSRFMKVNLVFRDRLKGRIINPMRLCQPDDFESRGFKLDSESLKDQMTKRICPDIKDFVQIKNSYSNPDRKSLSIEISVCNSKDCVAREKIEAMLAVLRFNIFYLHENIEYANTLNKGYMSLYMSDMFHSQFVLNLNSYRDNNNFLILNNLSTH